MHWTLRQLRIFEAVAEHGSYTHAARALHLTQPAVSMQLRQLEERIGLPLFDRRGKRLHLTEAGRALQRYAVQVRLSLEEAELVIDELRGLKRGLLRLTVASTANYFAPRLLAEFCHRHPGVDVRLHVTNRAGLLEEIETGEADMLIMGRPPSEDLIAIPFLDNPLVVIAPVDHPWSGRKRIPLHEVAKERFIVREEGSGTRAAVERFLAKHDIVRPHGMEMNSSEAIKQAVMAKLGLGIVSMHTLEMELAMNRLCVLDVEGFPIVRKWYIVHHEGRRHSRIATEFIRFVREEARQVLRDLPGVEP